jgi:Kef-type K+ transport system membrane component KefB
LCLGLAAIAGEIGLAAIIGAFLAGMVVAETKEHTEVEEAKPLFAFFPPFFFVFIGLEVELGALAEAGALALLAGVTALAVVTKLVACWIGARGLGRRERALVAFGMVPRGEVGIIVAGIGSTAGVIDAELFAVIVGMAVPDAHRPAHVEAPGLSAGGAAQSRRCPPAATRRPLAAKKPAPIRACAREPRN